MLNRFLEVLRHVRASVKLVLEGKCPIHPEAVVVDKHTYRGCQQCDKEADFDVNGVG
jgi:hypothetical protein